MAALRGRLTLISFLLRHGSAILPALFLAATMLQSCPAAAAGAPAVGLPKDVAKDGFAYGYSTGKADTTTARDAALDLCRKPADNKSVQARAAPWLEPSTTNASPSRWIRGPGRLASAGRSPAIWRRRKRGRLRNARPPPAPCAGSFARSTIRIARAQPNSGIDNLIKRSALVSGPIAKQKRAPGRDPKSAF